MSFARLRDAVGSPLGGRLLVTTLWSVAGEAASKGLLLIGVILVARTLGQEGYGEFGLIRTTVNLFALFGGIGLGLTANRYVAKHRSENKQFCGQIVGSSYALAALFGAGVAGILFLGAGYLGRDVLGAERLEGPLRVAALLLFAGALNGAQVGILQGLEAYRALAFGSLVQGLTALVTLTLGSHYFGLLGAVTGLVVWSLVGVVLFESLIRSEMRRQRIAIVWNEFADILPILWRFSVPVALMGVAVAPFKWIVETSLAKNSGFDELGVFHAGLNVANIFIVSCSALNAPLISMTSHLQGQNPQSSPRMQYVNLYGSWYLFLVLALPCLLFPSMPALLFGDSYRGPMFQAVTVLLLLYCGLLLIYQGIMRLLTLHGSLWFGLFTNLFEGASLLVSFWLLHDLGALGLALAYGCSYVVRILVSVPLLLRGSVIPSELLLDKFFLTSLVALSALVALQLYRIS